MWIWMRQHWLPPIVIGTILYLLSWVPTQITSMEILRELQNYSTITSNCTDGVVERRFGSLRQMGAESDLVETLTRPRFFLLIYHLDNTHSLVEVSEYQAQRAEPGTFWQCSKKPNIPIS